MNINMLKAEKTYTAAAQIFSIAAAATIFIMVAWFQQIANFGKWSVLTSSLIISQLLALTGTGFIAQILSVNNEPARFCQLLILKLVIGVLISIPFVWFIIMPKISSSTAGLTLLFILAVPFYINSANIEGWFTGRLKARLYCFYICSLQLTGVLSVAFFCLNFLSVENAFVFFFFAISITNMLIIIFLFSTYLPNGHFKDRSVAYDLGIKSAKQSLTLLPFTVAGLDRLLLAEILSIELVGAYSLFMSMLQKSKFLLNYFYKVNIRKIFGGASGEKIGELNGFVLKLQFKFLTVSLVMCAFIYYFGPVILASLSNDLLIPMCVLLIGYFYSRPTSFYASYLRSKEQYSTVFWTELSSVGLRFILIAILAHIYGLAGVFYGLSLAYCLFAFIWRLLASINPVVAR